MIDKRTRKRIGTRLADFCDAHGLDVEQSRAGAHFLVLRDGARIGSIANTPGDRRAELNTISDLRRALAERPRG